MMYRDGQLITTEVEARYAAKNLSRSMFISPKLVHVCKAVSGGYKILSDKLLTLSRDKYRPLSCAVVCSYANGNISKQGNN